MTSELQRQSRELASKVNGLNAEQLLQYMYSHQHYVSLIAVCLAWHTSKGKPFRWSDVRAFPRDLNRLVIDGVLSKEGNRGYTLTNPKAVSVALTTYYREKNEALKRLEAYRANKSTELPVPAGIPNDIFDDIVGYDDVKREILLALGAQDNIHVLLYGPPSTAKSLFLESLRSLPGARLTYGDAVSKAGLRRYVMEEKPQYLIIDEIDKMAPEDDTILLELMEHQTVSVMHYDQNDMQEISMRVFAAANNIKRMRPELLSRFHKIMLREYTQEEFIRVAFKHLTMRLRTDPTIADFIARGVAAKSRDIRDAVRIAKMSRTVQDAAFLISRLGTEANV